MYILKQLSKALLMNMVMIAAAMSQFVNVDATTGSGVDMSKMSDLFLDMKSYMALSNMEVTRGNLKEQMEPPPMFDYTRANVRLAPDQKFLSSGIKVITDNALTKYHFYMQGRSVTPEQYVRTHLRSYCSREEYNMQLCDNLAVDRPLDMLASTLLGRNHFENHWERKGAEDYIRNLINPLPMAMPEDPLADTGILKPSTLKHLATVYKTAPSLTLAQLSFSKMYADRVSSIQDGDANLTMSAGDKSLLQIIEDEASRRFFDPAWFSKINGAPEVVVIKDIAHMMSTQLVLNMRIAQHLERIEAISAAQIASLTQITTAGSAGTKQAQDAINAVLP